MTATFDLDVPVNLTVTPDGLMPVLDKIGVSNGVVTNSELLREDPVDHRRRARKASSAAGRLAVRRRHQPDRPQRARSRSLGLTLTIPETVDGKGSPGLRKLTKGTDNYLGIFATLGIGAMPLAPEQNAPVEVRRTRRTRASSARSVDHAGLPPPHDHARTTCPS